MSDITNLLDSLQIELDEQNENLTHTPSPSSNIHLFKSLDNLRNQETQQSQISNKKRLAEAPDSTFGSEFVWGLAESAMVAPGLWESLGKQTGITPDIKQGDIREKLGGYGIDDWDKQSSLGKVGYIAGAGAGMLIPFGAAGKIVQGVTKVGAKVIQVGQKVPFLTRAAGRELSERAGKLIGKSATTISDDIATKVIKAAEPVVSKPSTLRKIRGLKQYDEITKGLAKSELKAVVKKTIPDIADDAIDDVSRIAIDAVTHYSPNNAHEIIDQAVKGIMSMGGRRATGLPADLIGAYAYDAALGGVYGFAKYAAQEYGRQAWENDGNLTLSKFSKDTDWWNGVSHALDEAKWLGFLGPVRFVGGGTSTPLITVPRFWNKRKGTVNKMLGGIFRNLLPIKNVTPLQAKATLQMMDSVSNGAIRHLAGKHTPLLNKALEKNSGAFWQYFHKNGDEAIGALNEIRKSFRNNAPLIMGKEVLSDLAASLPRMGMGAVAMNLPSIKERWDATSGMSAGDRIKNISSTSFGEEWADIGANILVAMMMTRGARSIRRFDKPASGSAVDTGLQIGLNRGELKKHMTGQDTYIKEVKAGLEALGLSPTDRHNLAMNYKHHTGFPNDYGDSVAQSITETDATFKSINEKINNRSMNSEDISKLDLDTVEKEGKHVDLKDAYVKAAKEANLTPEQTKQWNKDMEITLAIENFMETYLGTGEITHKPMTPKEAREYVKEMSNTQIDGKSLTTQNLRPLLWDAKEGAASRVTKETYSQIQLAYREIAEALGLENISFDKKTGVVLVPEGLQLPNLAIVDASNGDSRLRNAMAQSFNAIHQQGIRLGWIKEQKKVTTQSFERLRGEGVEEAIDVFSQRLLAMHKMVYGENHSIETLRDGEVWNEFMMTADGWHYSYGDGKAYAQRKNVKSFFNNDFDKVETHLEGDEIRRRKLELDSRIGASKVELIESESFNSDEINDINKFIRNANKVYRLANPTERISDKSTTLTYKDAAELKQKTEEMFGNAFTDKDVMRRLEGEILQEGIDKIDLKNTDVTYTTSTLSLLTNPEFAGGKINSLRSVRDIDAFLDTMAKEGKPAEEIDMLKQFYSNLHDAVAKSESGVIKFNKETLPIDGIQDGLYKALQEAFMHSRRSNFNELISDSQIISDGLSKMLFETTKELGVIIDTDTDITDAVRESLFKTLSRTTDLSQALLDQITIAKREGNIVALNSIQKRKVDLDRALTELSSNRQSKTANEMYQQVLADLHKVSNEINSQPLNQNEIESIFNERLQLESKSSKTPIIEPPNTISISQFEAKYFVKMADYVLMERALNEPIQTGHSAIDLLEGAKRNIKMNVEKYGETGSTLSELESLDRAIESLKDMEGSKIMTGKEIIESLRKPLVAYMQSQLGAARTLGTLSTEQLASRLYDLDTDLNQIMIQAYATKQVRGLEYHRGKYNVSNETVPNTDRTGFLGIQRLLGLDGQMFVLKSSGINVDGKKFTRIDGTVREEIQNHLRNAEIISEKGASEFHRTLDEEAIRKNQDLIGDREFTLVPIDEGVDLLIDSSPVTIGKINSNFSWDASGKRVNSELMVTLDRILKDGLSSENLKLLEKFQNPNMSKETIEQAIYLTRAISDSKSVVESFLKSQMNDAQLKAEWKRLKMFEHRSGFTGTPENVSFVYELLKETVAESGSRSHALALSKVIKVFGNKGEIPLEFVVINDETGPVDVNGQMNYNPFDYNQSIGRRLEKQLVEVSGITDAEKLEVYDKIAKGKSEVDSVTYLTKDSFEALMSFLGVKDQMIEYLPNGNAMLRAGAIKPVITHSEVLKDGSLLEFVLKTSFQYNKAIAKVIPQGKHAIAFGSGAKKFLTREGKGANTNGEAVNSAIDPGKIPNSMMDNPLSEKINDSVNSLPRGVDINNHTAKIPLSSINLKQASREHTGLIAANTGVHFSRYGMEGMRKWTGIEGRLSDFGRLQQDMWLDPIRRTSIAKEVFGYSQETGDPLVLNTGLDFILENNGILVQDWIQPVIERSIISHHLNGGNISARKIYESETAVMTPDTGDLSLPFRTVDGSGRHVQRIFGGARISGFLGNKLVKFKGETNQHNSQAEDTAATIVKFSDGTEGILVHGLNNRVKGSTDATLFVDGYMVNPDGKIYDMSSSLTKEVNNIPFPDLLRSKQVEASEMGDLLKESLDLNTNGQVKLSSAMSHAKKVTANLYDKDGKKKSKSSAMGIWMASMSVRQPRNQAGDMIVEKLEGLTKGRGNVKETNSLDAIQTADADFDLDKITTYAAAPKEVWGEVNRLAGHTMFTSDIDIQNYITKEFSPYESFTDHKNNIHETAYVRAGFVKLHQTMTYLKNMFGSNEIARFNDGKDVLSIKLKQSTSELLNSQNVLSTLVKMYIDVYKDTPKTNPNFVRDAKRRVLFHPTQGMFDIQLIKDGQRINTNLELWKDSGLGNPYGTINTEYLSIIKAIESRFTKPINQYLQYNRGVTQLDGGQQRSSSIEDFANAYETMLHSTNAREWNGVQTKNESLDISAGLKAARDYFRSSSNPYDIGMREMQNIQGKKHKEINTFDSDIGKLVMAIEEGYIDTKSYEAKEKKILNSTWDNFIKNQFRAAELSALVRRQYAVESEMGNLETRYARMNIKESPEYKALELKKDRLAKLVKDTREIMGAGIDFESVMRNEFFDEVRLKGNREANKWTNNTNTTVVVRDASGKMKEIIRPNESNVNFINKKDVLLKHGRRWEFAPEQQTGAQINNIAFGMLPAYHSQGKSSIMSEGEFKKYEDWRWRLEQTLKIVDSSITNKQGRQIKNLSKDERARLNSERLRTLHEYVKELEFNSSSRELDKWAIIHALMQPKVDRSTMFAYPITGGKVKGMSYGNKVYMHNYGRTEKLLWDWLNEVRSTHHHNFKNSGISPSEAGEFMKNIIKNQKQALLIYERPYGDMRFNVDGFWTEPSVVNELSHFNQTSLHQEVYTLARHHNKSIRLAANTLLRYSRGEGGLVDPITIYKAQRLLETPTSAGGGGIPPNESFMRVKQKESNLSFGNYHLEGIKNNINYDRRTGTEGVIKDKPSEFIEEATRCLQ